MKKILIGCLVTAFAVIVLSPTPVMGELDLGTNKDANPGVSPYGDPTDLISPYGNPQDSVLPHSNPQDSVLPYSESQGGVPPGNIGELPNPLGVRSVVDLLKRIISVFTFYIAPAIATLMVVVGAFQMLGAGGDPEKFKSGKKTIVYAVVGLAILLVADLIIALIQEILGVQQK